MPPANNKKNNNRKRPPQPMIGDDVIASRTRRQKKMIASKWDLQTPIIIEIISWMNQDDLMNLSLVSKQLHSIIRNEPGNKNKIIPVFEVRVSSSLKLFQNLHNYSSDNNTNNKLQSYRSMVVNNFVTSYEPRPSLQSEHHWVHHIAQHVQMNGITSLYFSTPSRCYFTGNIHHLLSKISPNLCEVDFSDSDVTSSILRVFSENCPLLEKVTSHNNVLGLLHPLSSLSSCHGINLGGQCMLSSNNLKEIIIDNAPFYFSFIDKDRIADLHNHQEIFIFHKCCKAIECVSIRNMKYPRGFFHDDQKLIFTQNALIKFVRNAPTTLRWFRSDLTTENMTMLRLERPGIELLN
jgi:hypothetical protein